VGESGYGRLHGELGLREFAVPVHVSVNMLPRLKRVWWYPYDEATDATLRAFAEVLSAPTFGRRAAATRTLASNAVRALRSKI
jgi:hypothetical protein